MPLCTFPDFHILGKQKYLCIYLFASSSISTTTNTKKKNLNFDLFLNQIDIFGETTFIHKKEKQNKKEKKWTLNKFLSTDSNLLAVVHSALPPLPQKNFEEVRSRLFFFSFFLPFSLSLSLSPSLHRALKLYQENVAFTSLWKEKKHKQSFNIKKQVLNWLATERWCCCWSEKKKVVKVLLHLKWMPCFFIWSKQNNHCKHSVVEECRNEFLVYFCFLS